VLQARDPEASTRRLSAYQLAQRFEPLAIDEAASDALGIAGVQAARRGAQGTHQ
jgi:hypothetical protein